MFSKREEVKSIGNPAGIGKGTGFGLRERDRDGIGLGHYRLRANYFIQILITNFLICEAKSRIISEQLFQWLPKSPFSLDTPTT